MSGGKQGVPRDGRIAVQRRKPGSADPAKALVMLKKGCELGSPGACEQLKKLEIAK
ncbi:MAG: hypothetical protein H0T42_04810 [Deltaproteobacteria bacterium]|nr:hypothetical protein [Deltaproteobacteria bacterium]